MTEPATWHPRGGISAQATGLPGDGARLRGSRRLTRRRAVPALRVRDVLRPGEELMPAAELMASPTLVWAIRLLSMVVMPLGLGLRVVHPAEPLAMDFLQVCLFVDMAVMSLAHGWRAKEAWYGPVCYLVGIMALIPPLWDVSPWHLLHLFAADVAGSLVGLWLYRRREASLLPRDVRAVGRLALCLVVAVLSAQLLGGFPQAAQGSTPVAREVTTFLTQLAVLAVGTVAIFLLYLRIPTDELPPVKPGWYPLYLLGSIGCVAAPFQWGDHATSWLLLVPVLVAGGFFPPRQVGLAVLALGIAAAALPYPTATVGGAQDLGGVLSPYPLIDLIYAYNAFVALLLVVYRRQEAALVRHVRRRAAAQRRQAELRDSVLHGMTNGLMLTDPDGRVLLFNEAAADLLGGEPPARLSYAWGVELGIRRADNHQLITERGFDRFLHPRAGSINRMAFLMAGRLGERRVSLLTKDIVLGTEVVTMWLLRDTTARHQRHLELEQFADTVARELKEPLQALSGWIDAADEELRHGDPQAVQEAMEGAHQSVGRMRALIDDYLTYAVRRGGQAVLEPVGLDSVAEEITAVYGSGRDGVRFQVELNHQVQADPALIRQLFANLAGSAVRHAAETGPRDVSITSRATELGWIAVEFIDALAPEALREAGLDPVAAAQAQAEVHSVLQHAIEAKSRTFVADRQPGDDSDEDDALTGLEERLAEVAEAERLSLSLCMAIVARHGGAFESFRSGDDARVRTFTLPAAEPVRSNSRTAEVAR